MYHCEVIYIPTNAMLGNLVSVWGKPLSSILKVTLGMPTYILKVLVCTVHEWSSPSSEGKHHMPPFHLNDPRSFRDSLFRSLMGDRHR